MSDRFWAKVMAVGECWVWTGHRDLKGYGKLTVAGRPTRAHRHSWEIANGPVPPGLVVCHRCDNPSCVRPGHLFLGTHSDNVADRDQKRRQARGERSGRARMGPADVLACRYARVMFACTCRALAAASGVDESVMSRALNRKTWREL